ncbi:hypothetical protein ABBQ38_002760 [Trebouxia sp. C0009 RCD-2024]
MVSGDQEPSRAGPRAGDKRSRSVTIQSFGSDRPYIGPFGRTPFVRWSVIPPPKPSQPRIIRPAPRMVYRPPAAQQNSVPCDYEEGGEAHADNADPLRGHGALVGSSGEQQTATSSGDRTVSSSQHAATFQPTADRDQGFSQAAAAPDDDQQLIQLLKVDKPSWQGLSSSTAEQLLVRLVMFIERRRALPEVLPWLWPLADEDSGCKVALLLLTLQVVWSPSTSKAGGVSSPSSSGTSR